MSDLLSHEQINQILYILKNSLNVEVDSDREGNWANIHVKLSIDGEDISIDSTTLRVSYDD